MNQRRTKERPKNSESIEVHFVKINKHIYPPLLILKQALYVWNFETFQLKICTSANFVVPLHRKPSVCRHIKSVYSACFGVSKSGKFQLNPRQEGSKRLLGYVYPAAERPLWTALFGGISYSAWALLFILV